MGWFSIVSSYVSPLRSWIRAEKLLKSGPKDNEDSVHGNDDNTEEEAETNGLFKLSPTKKPFIFQGESLAPPVFRGRSSSVNNDNFIVIFLTICALGASVAAFLFINKDLPAPPPSPPIRF
jgi:hypothetical protein